MNSETALIEGEFLENGLSRQEMAFELVKAYWSGREKIPVGEDIGDAAYFAVKQVDALLAELAE